MSRGLCTLALMATGWRAADAHGHMSKPAPREPLWLPQYDDGAHTAVGATYRWDEPVYTIAGPKSISGHQYSANAFRCRESRPSAPPFQQLVAGQTIDVEWTVHAAARAPPAAGGVRELLTREPPPTAPGASRTAVRGASGRLLPLPFLRHQC